MDTPSMRRFAVPDRAELLRATPHVDDLDVLEKAEKWPALRFQLEGLRPCNLWGSGVSGGELMDIAKGEGIPVTWVPRSAVVRRLADVPGGAARDAVLTSEIDTIIEDCVHALDASDATEIAETVGLARRAVEACRAGHREAAVALLVSISEPLTEWALSPRVNVFESDADHDAYENQLRSSGYLARVGIEDSRAQNGEYYRLFIAPMYGFFARYDRRRSDPTPDRLSRHLMAHGPTVAHLTEANLARALLLVTSILREQQDWIEEVLAQDTPG